MRGNGRLFQRGAVWWVAYYHRGQEIRESSKGFVYKEGGKPSDGTDRRAAEKLLRERLRTAGTPHFVGPTPNGWRHVAQLRTVFGFDRALDITSDRITEYVALRLEDGFAPASVNRKLAALRRMLSLAVKAGKLTHRPHVPMLAEDNARQGFLEPADFAAVQVHLPAYLADAATFAYLTGWRKGEVRSLEWRDVDLDGGVIRLRAEHSKNKRPRVVALRGEVLAMIEKRAAIRVPECTRVFHRDGHPLGDFRKAWQAACHAAGHDGRIFHDMRRSAIRNMIRAGVPERVAMAVSGHRTRAVFDRYNIVSEDDLAAAMDRTDAYLSARRDAPRRVVPLAARGSRSAGDPSGGEHGQNTDNQANRESTLQRGIG